MEIWDDVDIPRSSMGRHVRQEVEEEYSSRYRIPRDPIPRAPSRLVHLLTVIKHKRPDDFRLAVRVTPQTFDSLVAALQDDPVFANDSPNAQLAVEHQLVITLYRFGHYGNGVSVHEVSVWAGVGAGTVLLVTRRVITALLRPSFLQQSVRMPTDDGKKRAKRWVHQQSGCSAWQHGWLLVDGTLVPLYTRPHWYGESYFDRKCNYSLNIQVSNLTSA